MYLLDGYLFQVNLDTLLVRIQVISETILSQKLLTLVNLWFVFTILNNPLLEQWRYDGMLRALTQGIVVAYVLDIPIVVVQGQWITLIGDFLVTPWAQYNTTVEVIFPYHFSSLPYINALVKLDWKVVTLTSRDALALNVIGLDTHRFATHLNILLRDYWHSKSK